MRWLSKTKWSLLIASVLMLKTEADGKSNSSTLLNETAATITTAPTELKNSCLSLLYAIERGINLDSEIAKMQKVLRDFPAHNIVEVRKSVENQSLSPRVRYMDRQRVEKAVMILKSNLETPPSLKELAKRVGCSSFYLSRIFSRTTGRTMAETLTDLRIEKASQLLSEGRFNVTETALEVGYSSMSHFSTVFRQKMGVAPKDYRR